MARRVAATPLGLSALVLVGCGSSSGSSPHPTVTAPICPPGHATCVSTSTSVDVVGPRDVAANLTQAMTVSNPTLSQVRLSCAANQPAYPKVCQFTATSTSKAKQIDVSGEVSAFGVDTRTHTYAYTVNYAPVTN